MVDIWDLGRYVEDHPDEYDKRWRLAKKLYLACEYRLALEHLQVLRNEWVRKLNVVRYLAATYYRLGRYDEAVDELKEAIEVWPEEVGLREQLARVLEVAGRPQEASRLWEQVAQMDPDHAIARQAADRLLSPPDNSPEEELRIHESDSGIDLAPKRACPYCGAQNSVEFDRCWQCHELLMALPSAPAAPRARTQTTDLRRAANILGALALVAVLAYGAYLVIAALPSAEPAPDIEVSPTIFGTLLPLLLQTRLVLGLVLLVAWPIVLFLAVRWVPSDQPNPGIIALAGLFLGALAFGALWAPIQLAAALGVVLLLVSFLLMLSAFGLSFRDTIVAWMIQAALVFGAGAVALVAVEGPRPLIEAPAILRYTGEHDGAREPTYRFDAPPAPVSARYTVQWKSSGSVWLDRKLNAAQFEVVHSVPGPALSFEVKERGKAVFFEKFSGSPFRARIDIEPAKPFEVNVRGVPEQFGQPVGVAVYSLLEPVFDIREE